MSEKFDELDALRYWQDQGLAQGFARPLRFLDCDQPYVPPNASPPPKFHLTTMTLDQTQDTRLFFEDWPEPPQDHSRSYADQAGHTWYTRATNGRRLRVPTQSSWVDRRRDEHLRLVLADPTFGDPCKLCGRHLKGRGLVATDMHYANLTFTVRRGTRYGARMHLYRVHGIGKPL